MDVQAVVSPGPGGSTTLITPIAKQERINSVDVIRGVAVLGILLMNIASFALPHQAYSDPTVAGGATGTNLAVWAINYVLFEGKMRAIFSILFGAGMVIFMSRGEKRGAELRDHADGIFAGNLSGDPNAAPRVYACGSDEGFIMFSRDGEMLTRIFHAPSSKKPLTLA